MRLPGVSPLISFWKLPLPGAPSPPRTSQDLDFIKYHGDKNTFSSSAGFGLVKAPVGGSQKARPGGVASVAPGNTHWSCMDSWVQEPPQGLVSAGAQGKRLVLGSRDRPACAGGKHVRLTPTLSGRCRRGPWCHFSSADSQSPSHVPRHCGCHAGRG